MNSKVPVDIRPACDQDRVQLQKIVKACWGEAFVVTQGMRHETRHLDALVAAEGQAILGVLHYRIMDEICEIITLAALIPGRGIGTALLSAVEAVAKSAGCKKLIVITTNDNLNALRFYQKRGFCLRKVFPGQLTVSRRLKPSIPEIGNEGIPLRDELRLEKDLY
jgi:N-acetylglutamate synthase-like GNAT family acetyltransferase